MYIMIITKVKLHIPHISQQHLKNGFVTIQKSSTGKNSAENEKFGKLETTLSLKDSK